jgi:hypothetical protein
MDSNRNKDHLKTLIALSVLAGGFSGVSKDRKPSINKVASNRKKTKKGATHIVGKPFKSRFLIYIDEKPVTPAMYRRMHMGIQNPRKKNGSQSTH